MKLINIWYTQFDISYRPRSKRTNWVLFYLICFSVINSPAEGIIPSRKREIKKREEKKKHQIYHSAQTVGRATVKHPCYYGIGNLVSWVWVETQTFFFFFFLCAWWFSFQNQVQTQRQEDRHSRSSDTVRLHLLQRAPVTSCLSFFLWNFWVAWCIWHVCDSAGCVRLGLRHHARYPGCMFFFF